MIVLRILTKPCVSHGEPNDKYCRFIEPPYNKVYLDDDLGRQFLSPFRKKPAFARIFGPIEPKTATK
jgi:hypothetical protein